MINDGTNATPGYVSRFAKELGLQLVERFTRGNSGALVYRASSRSGNPLVLKIATEGRALDELRENIIGSQRLKDEGLENLLPGLYCIYERHDCSAIVMDHLGDSFYEAVQKSQDPVKIYKNLAIAFTDLCIKSRRRDEECHRMLLEVKSNLLNKYKNFLLPNGLIRDHHVSLVERIDIESLSLEYSTFATYDFTPEDVFPIDGQLKLPDPRQNIRGCPIISLAAFAGVSRDSYELPGSVRGYKVLNDFAVGTLAKRLDIQPAHASGLFLFGRSMQLAISAKVRIRSDPEKARLFASQSVDAITLMQANRHYNKTCRRGV